MNTPRSLGAQAELYRRLAQYLSAGIPVLQALDSLHRAPPNRSFRPFIGTLRDTIQGGGSLAEGFRAGPRFAPALDTTLIEASERSGRLDRCFERLAASYEENARQLTQALAALLYPAAILHIAVLLAPLPAWVLSGNFIAYASQVLLTLLPLYAVVFGLAWIFLGRHGERWRGVAERVFNVVPFLGSARRSLALARLAETLDALLAAGVNIVQAWPLAAKTSGSPAIQRRVASWHAQLAEGGSPGELLERSREFPHLFASHYRTGELSGSLDQSLVHLHTLYLDEGNRRMRTLARVLPFGIYLLVVIGIAIHIIQFYLGYYGGVFRNLGL